MSDKNYDTTTDIINSADSELDQMLDAPYTVEEFIDLVLENPSFASHSAKYLLEAIESFGTRTVIEQGEEYERYVFFDDPCNDGQNAILGNTSELNRFVKSLRNIASGTGKTEKMLWIHGPTATGKSEFKRCLINGLKGYSKTPEGSRYTLEWSENNTQTGDPTYGNPTVGEQNWETSPVQVNPLSILPENTLENVLETINKNERYPATPKSDLDPFSEEYFSKLCDTYRESNDSRIFNEIISNSHVRVKNYIVDVGNGIGLLHSEDIGDPKRKLVGGWMQTQGLWSKGKRNPLAFSYDGVLCQGNGIVTVIEDAYNHKDLIRRLLNVIDEEEIKLDQQTILPIDTQFILISNPDMKQYLNQSNETEGDPLKALRRRLESHQFNYLLNYSLETKLIKRELMGGKDYTVNFSDEVNIAEPIHIDTYDSTNVSAKEIAPHGIESAAIYNILTRIADTRNSKRFDGYKFDLIDKVLLLDRGVIYKGDNEYELEDVNMNISKEDGRKGMPVTYSRDVIAELITSEQSRSHKQFNFENVIMPQDIVDEMEDQLVSEPLFSDSEVEEFEEKATLAKKYIFQQQEEDVLNSAMEGLETSQNKLEEYVENVYSWDESDESSDAYISTEDDEVDALAMKLFEVENLGLFESSDYDSATHEPTTQEVRDFRRDNVIIPINIKTWESKKDDFQPGDVEFRSIEVFDQYLSTFGWGDIRREFTEFDPHQWENPPENTETEELKEKVISNMIDKYNYSRESAEIASTIVMNEVSQSWD